MATGEAAPHVVLLVAVAVRDVRRSRRGQTLYLSPPCRPDDLPLLVEECVLFGWEVAGLLERGRR
jgi:hypothetical protein